MDLVLEFLYFTKNDAFHAGFLQKIKSNPEETEDLLTFTKEIVNGKLNFRNARLTMQLCSRQK